MTLGAKGRTTREDQATRSQRRRSEHRTRGQGLVEFALILPVLMLMLVVTIDFGRVFLSYIALNNATRVAANFGSVNPNSFTGTPNTTTYNAVVGADTASLAGICPIRAVASHNPPLPTYPSGTGLAAVSEVTFTCDFSFLTPLMNGFFGGALPMSATARFPVRTGALANISGTTTLPPPGAPVAAFAFTGVSGGTVDGSGNVTGTSPVTVNFQDMSVNAQTWSWDFGDASLPYDTDGAPPTHTYTVATAQTYLVTLTVSNTVGSSSVTHTVTVNPATTTPVAGFYGTPVGSAPQAVGGGASGTAISGSRSLVVNFTNTSTDTNAYSWDFGDGTPPDTTHTSPQHTYTTLGIFTVVLTVTDPTGVPAVTRNNYVTVGCVVPNFAGTSTANAASTWAAAGFTGSITYQKKNGASSSSPPSPSKNIQSQTNSASTPSFNAAGGAFDAPVQVSGVWKCTGDITLVYP